MDFVLNTSMWEHKNTGLKSISQITESKSMRSEATKYNNKIKKANKTLLEKGPTKPPIRPLSHSTTT